MTADEKHGRFYLFPRRIPHQLPNYLNSNALISEMAPQNCLK